MERTDGDRHARVLLVDDDDGVRDFVRSRLEQDGLEVVEASTGARGLELSREPFDVVLLDVGLPDVDGFSVLRAIRSRSSVPVLMMTAAADEADRVLGLDLGADDYVVKPFLPRELVARVRAALRRGGLAASTATTAETVDVQRFGPLTIDRVAREASVSGRQLGLTAREFDLLAFLAAAPQQVIGRDELLRGVWRVEPGWLSAATVTEHVRRIRVALDRHPECTARIVTAHGAGYRFVP